MDRTLKRAARRNRRRQDRNSTAWQRFSPDGRQCRFCPHDDAAHLCTSSQPHFYRPATGGEQRDGATVLYRHVLPDGGSVLVRRVTVARDAEIVTAFCTACASRMRTDQVLCYHRTRAVGEVVGVNTDTDRNTKEPKGEST